MEIVSGIHQLKIPLGVGGLDHVNAYLVEGDKGNLLIDCGWDTPEAQAAMKAEMATKGFDFRDVSQIVVTHIHSDHYGMAGRIREASGAKVAMSKIEADMIDLRYVRVDALLEGVSFLLNSCGVPENFLKALAEASMPVRKFVTPVMPDVRLKSGDKISVGQFEFKVMLTPGHSLGHICLYEPKKRYLFSGDHVLAEIAPHVGRHPQSGDNPLGDFLKSLEEMVELNVSFVFPGHGPVFNGIRQRTMELLQHHKERKAAILKAIKDESKTAYQIATEIPWMPEGDAVNFTYLSDFDKRLAVLEALAHLQYLIAEGTVESVVEHGVNYFFVVPEATQWKKSKKR